VIACVLLFQHYFSHHVESVVVVVVVVVVVGRRELQLCVHSNCSHTFKVEMARFLTEQNTMFKESDIC
jgi:hypothetical protein